MGMLDFLGNALGKVGQVVSSPGFADGVGYYQARRAGVPAIAALGKLQEIRSDRAQDAYYASQQKLDEQKLQQQQEELQREEQERMQREAYQQMQMDEAARLSSLTPEQIQAYWQDPANIAAWNSPYANQDITKAIMDRFKPVGPDWIKTVDGRTGQVVLLDKNSGRTNPTRVHEHVASDPLVEVFDETSPTGTRMVPRESAQGMPGKPSMGFEVTTNADGTTSIAYKPVSGAGVSKPVQSQLEGKIVDAARVLGELSTIESKFRPEYQELGTRWKDLMTTGRLKLGMGVNDTDRQQHAAFADYRASAASHTSQIISDLYGAVLAPNEEARANNFLINPGKGLFDGDDPIAVKRKIAGLRKLYRDAMIRNRYVLAHGFRREDVSLEEVPELINQRGLEIERELQMPPSKFAGLDDKERRAEVKRRLSEEFGI